MISMSTWVEKGREAEGREAEGREAEGREPEGGEADGRRREVSTKRTVS